MVGHLLRYHPAILKLKELCRAGELGRIEYVYSNRLNLGKVRREENALWSFAPHDVSVLLHLFESMPLQVSTTGGTSDARFLSRICPVVEFGLLNATMHKLDEAVALDDLHKLTAIYANLLRRVFG